MKKRAEVDFSMPNCQPFMLEGGDHGVLLIHGFTGSCSHMRQIGDELNEQGFTVMGINLPGHATHMMDMANYSWEDWLNACKTAFADLKKVCKHVSVAGLSMGGVLTLLLGEQMQPTAIAPISAPMGVQNKLLPFAGIAAPFIKTIMWRDDGAKGDMMAKEYHFGYQGFPTKSGADLYKLIRMARRDLHAITCPLLVVQTHADATITHDSADVIMQGATGTDRKGVMWLDNVPHVCTISPEYQNIAREIGQLFRNAEG